MKYILALDQGTTSSRSVLISQDGQIVKSAQKEFRQIFPQPGWVEHDANEIWSSQLATLQEVGTKEIHAIGITNQRETTIVWDRKTGQPICNAIVWQDRRTTDLCKELKKFESLFKQKTGLLLDPYFSGTKLHWILHHIPDALERAKKGELAFGTVDSWLVWNLTKGKHHITDVTNASRTLLFNIHTLKWDDELLKILDIPPAILPQVKSSSEIYATASILPGNIPISGIAGDQQAALFGQACIKPGMVKTTYGTGCFLLMNTGDKPVLSKNNLITTIAYQIGPTLHYALEGSVFIAGAVVQWLRDSLGIIKASSDIEKLGSSVQDNGGVYFVPAFTGLGAPHWDPYARGAILGLTRGATAAHIARAALEGIAFQVADVIKCMEEDAGVPTAEMRVDGGAVRDNLLMQIQADFLQVPVIRPQITELTALGAGFLAGLATGFWKEMDDIAKYWKEDERFLPQMLPENAKRKRGKWSQALKCAQLWENA